MASYQSAWRAALAQDLCMCMLGLSGGLGKRGVKRRKLLHHDLVALGHVGVYRLGMLSEVVEARKGFAAMATEWPLSCMFADVTSKMLAAGKDHATVAKASALKHGDIAARLRLLLIGFFQRTIRMRGRRCCSSAVVLW